MNTDTDFESMTPYQKYMTLWNEYLGDRPGAGDLLEMMKAHGFFEAPASKGHHLATPGGLCLHSYHVADRAIELCARATAFAACDAKAVAVAALLHDLCKLDKYVPTTRRVKNKVTGYWEDAPGYAYQDTRLLGHGEESVMLAMEYIHLTEKERLAIRWHMGAYADSDKLNTMSAAFDACPEAMCVHFADMIATHIDEA